jgi:hypothetical protein
MSGEHAKKEMETVDKTTTSHGESYIGRVLQQGEGEGEESLFPQVASEWRQEKEDEEGGLLRDRYFITFHLRLRCTIHHF